MVQSNFELKVKIQQLIDNQIPDFILEENPKFSEFLQQYYISQEHQSGVVDIIENLSEYLKLDNFTPEIIEGETTLTQQLTKTATTIYVSSTKGFPNSYGLLQIDDEIITYKEKLNDRFVGCVRAFSGINSYDSELVFNATNASSHTQNSKVFNLSVLFLKKFYEKIKFTFLPGLEKVNFHSSLNVNNFIKNSVSFHRSKGTRDSFRILFNALYSIEPSIVDLESLVFKTSDSSYKKRKLLIFENLSEDRDPTLLSGYQIVKSNDPLVFGSVSQVEIFTRNNKPYYKFYIFIGYDQSNTENVGDFIATPSTKVVETIISTENSKVLTVDSTIGFPKSGSVFVNEVEIFYTDKSVNQFFGCYTENENYVNLNIEKTSTVYSNDTYFGYENGDKNKKINLRLLSITNDLIVNDENTSNYIFTEGDEVYIKELGNLIDNPAANRTQSEIIANSFIYNTSSRYELEEINAGSSTGFTLSPVDKSSLKVGDYVEFLERNTEIKVTDENTSETLLHNVKINSINFNQNKGMWEISFDAVLSNLNPLKKYDIRRKIKTANSNYLIYDNITCDVSNLYSEQDKNFYVASNSLPSYEITKNVVSYNADSLANYNSTTAEYSSVKFNTKVSLISGDRVYYTYTDTPIGGLSEGSYYIKVSENKEEIFLYISKSFLLTDNYVRLKSIPSGVHNFILESQRTDDKKIYPQKIFKKILTDVDTFYPDKDSIGTEQIGILVNGVEIASYKSNDKVYYGSIDSVKVLNGGEDYDVINPPRLEFVSGNAKVQPVIRGSIKSIHVDPQDFNLERPLIVKVSGGNGKNVSVLPIINLQSRDVLFNAQNIIEGGGLDTEDETITFLTPHNFIDGQKIIYDLYDTNNEQIGLGTFKGSDSTVTSYLPNNSIFYAEIVNDRTIKIYSKYNDYRSGINTVGFTTVGNRGFHKFKTEPKKVLDSIKVINGGEGFTNRKLIVNPSGISTYNNSINFVNHGFSTGELVTYAYATSTISGLSTTNQYYVLKVNDDSFRVCNAGIGGTDDKNYLRKNYVKFLSTGSGYQYFNYPEIKVDILYANEPGQTLQSISATPVVTGSIIETYVYEKGSGYGSSIVNVNNSPDLKILNGNYAQLRPVIIGGRIEKVLISYSGLNYYSVPDIVIDSKSGTGAEIRVTVLNGKISSAIIIRKGYGYNQNDTTIRVVPKGKNGLLSANVSSFTLNNSYKYGVQNSLYRDPSYEFLYKTKNNTLQYLVSGYSSLLFTLFDESPLSHSPIIGWSYDGIPIYGPFGYSDPEKVSAIKLLKSGYKTFEADARVSTDLFPLGSFVEDYKFTNSGDLDEYNGRFCKTPEYPNGVYAYFATAKLNPDGNYVGEFPYFVGNNYRSKKIDENFDKSFDQDFNFNSSNLLRNTLPYKSGQKYGRNDFIPYNLENFIYIDSTSKGSINNVEITNGGENYKVGDLLYFDSNGVGYGFQSSVETINGEQIDQIQSRIKIYENAKLELIANDKFYIRYQPSYEISNNTTVTISGLTSSFAHLNGDHKVFVNTFNTNLFSNVSSGSIGVVTDIYLSNYPNLVSIGSSIKISGQNSNEYFKILNYFNNEKVLRVERTVSSNSSFGISTAKSLVEFLPDIIFKGFTSGNTFENKNYPRYFNPVESVGVGTTSGTFVKKSFYIGNTLKEISIPTQSIYLPNHGFFTGQKVVIKKPNSNLGSFLVSKEPTSAPFSILNSGTSEELYIVNKSKDYIGISTSSDASQNTNGLYFRQEVNPGNVSGVEYLKYKYSFESVYGENLCNITQVSSTVSVSTYHNLVDNDEIFLTLKSKETTGIGTTSISLKYNDNIKSITINTIKFDASQVNVEYNRLNILNHNLKTGDKVYYISTSIIGGLSTGSYYINKIDLSNISLCETYEDSISIPPTIINLTSAGIGTQEISLIQPQIYVIKNNDLLFDVSDSSLEDYTFKLYADKNLTKEFISTKTNDTFSLVGFNTIGVSSDAKITLKYSNQYPEKLYYTLEKNNTLVKLEDDVINSSEIIFIDSFYSGKYSIFNTTNETFDISLSKVPEKTLYTYDECDVLEYYTNSKTASGSVNKIKIVDNGVGYDDIPFYEKSNSKNGNGLSINPLSKSIGKINSKILKNNEFEYATDKTLSPKADKLNIFDIESSKILTSVSVAYGGKGYFSAPQLTIVDSITKEKINKGLLKCQMSGNSFGGVVNIQKVNIENPVYGLPIQNVEIKATNNSNGIRIDTILSSTNNTFTCLLQTPILGFRNDPFTVGEEVYVENIENYGTSGKGFNSEDHGYQFFKIDDYVSESNPGQVTIRVPEPYGNIGVAVTFQINTSASIIKKSNYPIFTVSEDYALFLVGEKISVVSGSEIITTDLQVKKSNKNYLKLFGSYILNDGDIIQGTNSGYLATIKKITSYDAKFSIGSEIIVDLGWETETGKISNSNQFISDNDYYQNLSYTIKSEKTWNEISPIVNSLVHPIGTKNFADTQLLSSTSGISTSGLSKSSYLDIFETFETSTRVDTIKNFDLVSDFNIDSQTNQSRFIKFKNVRLIDYFEVLSNRGLQIDDISPLFSSEDDEQKSLFGYILNLPSSPSYNRFLIQIKSSDNNFTDLGVNEIQLTEIIALKDKNDVSFIEKSTISNSYSIASDNVYGKKLVNIVPNVDEANNYYLTINPINPYDIDYDVKVFQSRFLSDINSSSSFTIGSSKIFNSSNKVIPQENKTILSINSSTYSSIFSQIYVLNTKTFESEYVEIYGFDDGTDIYFSDYYFNSQKSSDETITDFSYGLIGSFGFEKINQTINLNCFNKTDLDDLIISSKTICFDDTSIVGTSGTYRFKTNRQPDTSERTLIISSGTTSVSTSSTIFSYDSNLFSSVKSYVKVSIGNTTLLTQLMTLHDDLNSFTTEYPILLGGKNNIIGIGTFSSTVDQNNLRVSFTPFSDFENKTINITYYNEVFYKFFDEVNIPTSLNSNPLQEKFSVAKYFGLNSNNINRLNFPLNYRGTPICYKKFDPGDTDILDISTGIFTIDNHFFSNGEKLIYNADKSFIGIGVDPLGIAAGSITDAGISTNKLPSSVYAIKLSNNQFKIALTKQNALNGVSVAFTGRGEGNAHSFEMSKKNEKSLITVNNLVQYPLIYTGIAHSLFGNNGQIGAGSTFFTLSGISTIKPTDLLKIDNEYMKVIDVGIGTTSSGPILYTIGDKNIVKVERGFVGTSATSHLDGSKVSVYKGSYNINKGELYFTHPPRGNIFDLFTTNESNLKRARATFTGRIFLRNNYDTNVIFDDISSEFTGVGQTFVLKSQGINTVGFGTTSGNGILFINGIYQTPFTENITNYNFEIVQNTTLGITSVVFSGIRDIETDEVTISESDVNQNQLPRGGLIVSLGSTSGLGYAPLFGAKVKPILNNDGAIVSIVGIATTGSPIAFTTVTYNNKTGILDVFAPSTTGLTGVNQVKIVGLAFTCSSNSGIVSYFPSHNDSLNIIGIGTTSFSVQVGTSTLPHYYVGYGTIYPWYEDLNFGSGYRSPVSIGITDSGHTGDPATITASVGAGGTLSFNIGAGGTGYSNPTIQISPPNYENLEVIGVSRLGIGETTETGIGLLMNVEIGPSIDSVGIGSTLYQVSNFKITRPGYNFKRGDILKPVGLVTARDLQAPIEEFKLVVLETYNDNFAAWQLGEFNLIDSVKKYQDGRRLSYPLYYEGQLLSFESNSENADSQFVDMDSLLVIFINGILQEPNYSYVFLGGSIVRFLTAPKKDDDIRIYFFVGTRGEDSKRFNIKETIKIGDTVQIYSNNSNLPTTITQEARNVFDLVTSTTLETNLYTEQGIDQLNLKPIYWTKQKSDYIINENVYSKSRDSLEPLVYPHAKIIKDFSSSDNELFVDSVKLFNYDDEGMEEGIDLLIIPEQTIEIGIVTAVVSSSGTVQSLVIENSGKGYSGVNTSIKISNPYYGILNTNILYSKSVGFGTTSIELNRGVGIGTTATAELTILNGSISQVSIINPGFGYTQSNPPQVIVQQPSTIKETVSGANVVVGFDGVITGIGTTVGIGTDLGLTFTLHKLSGNGNFSDLSVGYPIYIFNTKVGNGLTSINSNENQIVGISTTFIDNIYTVHGINTTLGIITCNISSSSNIVGIATTGIISNPVGRFSWGKIGGFSRSSSPISIGISHYTISGLTTYPSIQRRGSGLRKTGALQKDLTLDVSV